MVYGCEACGVVILGAINVISHVTSMTLSERIHDVVVVVVVVVDECIGTGGMCTCCRRGGARQGRQEGRKEGAKGME
jgi:hypothetical protein